MCKTCQEICDEIEEIFGHTVDPTKLGEPIESSPLKDGGGNGSNNQS